jgi:hypothetical protein
MTGHMRKRGANSWQLIVHLGHDDRGRRRSASKTVRGTKREAEVALAELVTEVAMSLSVHSPFEFTQRHLSMSPTRQESETHSVRCPR